MSQREQIRRVPHQTRVVLAGYRHHSTVMWDLITADPSDTDVGYFFEITKGLPLTKRNGTDNKSCVLSHKRSPKIQINWSGSDLTTSPSQLSLVWIPDSPVTRTRETAERELERGEEGSTWKVSLPREGWIPASSVRYMSFRLQSSTGQFPIFFKKCLRVFRIR